MALDPVVNFGKVTVSTTYDASASSIALTAGHGANLPQPSTDGAFNVTWWNTTDYADPSDDPNREIVRVTARSTDTLTVTRAQEGTSASTKNTASKTYKMVLAPTKKMIDDIGANLSSPNLLKNGNFINNSTNGYGSTPDDWTSSNANPVQGGIPVLTKQNLIDGLGIADGDIEGLWPLNETSGNALDLSSNGYNLTDTNTVGSSSDGLMAKSRDYESSSSQYHTIADASCPNLEMSGSQTWFCFIKPESIASSYVMAKTNAGITTYHILNMSSTGVMNFQMTGLTTNTSIASDIILQTGKWYFVVGVYDSANSKLKIWVNGVKKEVTASGSANDTNGNFVLGRADNGGSYYDGLMQNAGVLSVALTNNQVKKLLAMTLYKGQKIRRATTNGYLYQDLPMDLVERLRGRTVALRADMYQEVSSTGQISILQTLADGTTSETIISATDATTGSWLEKVASGAISSTAVGIQIRLKHSTSDGNTWFRRVSLYEGSVLLPYDHSKDDWSRIPRLLKMDIPASVSGYQFEEFKTHTWTPTWTGFSANPTGSYKFIISGKMCGLMDAISGFGTSNATTMTSSLPVVASSFLNGRQICQVRDNGSDLTGRREISSTTVLSWFKDLSGNAFTGSGSKWGSMGGLTYEID